MKARVAATVKRLRLYEEGAAGSDEEVAEGSDEVGSLQDVLDQVCSALRVKAVHLQSVMPGNRAQHKGSRFLSVDGDEAVQLGQIKKLFTPGSKQGKSGYTAEVKFMTAHGDQPMNLAADRYDP